MLTSLFLTGCGGGGKSNTEIGSETAPSSKSSVISSSSMSSTISSSSKPKVVNINGTVEKGPFIIGSNISIGKLTKEGNSTESTLLTQTTNDLGDFAFSYEENTLLQINANGYYRNEITGELSTGILNLRSIYITTPEQHQNAHVNILTHLISNRILNLISAGSSAVDAITTAQTEMLLLLDNVVPSPTIKSFASLSLYNTENNEQESAYLTLISSLFYQYSLNLAQQNKTNPDAELSLILNKLASDFANGTIEDLSILQPLRNAIHQLDPTTIQLHLNEFAALAKSSSTPANINLYLDSDLDGVANEYDTDDDNDGILDINDKNQYKINLVTDDLNLETDEDTNLPITLTPNNPTSGIINYVITQQPSKGILTGNFPNVIYQPNINFNGSDVIKLYLSQEDVNSDPITIKISVLAKNDNPSISGSPTSEINAYTKYNFTPAANDVDGDHLTFTLFNAPDWLSISSDTGEIDGAPTNNNAGIYSNISIKVSDGKSEALLPSFKITVNATPWAQLQDIPITTSQGASAEYNGIIYYFGGTASKWDSVYAYNPQNDTWTQKTSMPKSIHNLTAHTIDNKIYIIAGYGKDGFINDTLVYDPVNDSWSSKAPRPTYRYIFSSAEVNGLIYVIGGHGTVDDGPWRSGVDWSYKNYVEIYNPQTDSWTNGQPSPSPIASHASCVLNGKIYSIGGALNDNLLSSVYVYDPALNSWETLQNMREPKTRLSCGVINGKLFVFGGYNSSSALSNVASFDAADGTWIEHSPMTNSRFEFPVTILNNKAYVIGGASNTSLLDKTEVYDPTLE